MSSPSAERSKAKRAPARKKTVARKTSAAKTRTRATNDVSTQALALAALLERGVSDGNMSIVSERALQELMAALCKTYSAQIEAGHETLPLRGRTAVSSTDIMTTASGLLKAANLAVFELGMWQSWTGR